MGPGARNPTKNVENHVFEKIEGRAYKIETPISKSSVAGVYAPVPHAPIVYAPVSHAPIVNAPVPHAPNCNHV